MPQDIRLNGAVVKLVIVWLGIVVMGAFWLSVRENRQPVSLTVMPSMPRQGEPVVASYSLNNPSQSELVASYQFCVNGVPLIEGEATIVPLSSKSYKYVFASPVKLGDRISFSVRSSSVLGHYDRTVSIPPFPPQIASSFISFASFSTTVMTSMASMSSYSGNFTTTNTGLNTGLVISVCLILLLVFMELSGAAVERHNASGSSGVPGAGVSGGMLILNRFRYRFATLSWLLLIIFFGIVLTKISMILSNMQP